MIDRILQSIADRIVGYIFRVNGFDNEGNRVR